MIGAWLLALGMVDRATLMAAIVGKAARPDFRFWWSGDAWSYMYPTQSMSDRWAPALISVAGQKLMPQYYARHDFSDDNARAAFERLVDQLPSGNTPRETDNR
jgi:hypothetical protein